MEREYSWTALSNALAACSGVMPCQDTTPGGSGAGALPTSARACWMAVARSTGGWCDDLDPEPISAVWVGGAAMTRSEGGDVTVTGVPGTGVAFVTRLFSMSSCKGTEGESGWLMGERYQPAAA
jgi:hypothetical protein